jgi:hypothetical protein
MVNDVPAGIVDVMNAADQEVVIDVRGPDVLNISGNSRSPTIRTRSCPTGWS